jgi:hypothetical protein
MLTNNSQNIPNKNLRVISVAWGLPFLNDLLNFSLPSLNSKNNLPYLAKYFSVTLVIVTESKFFDYINQTQLIKEFEKYCKVELKSLDDLITAGSQAYGMALTYSLYRGFEHLKEKMVDCYLLFLNSDFILADGCYKNLLPHLLRDEKIIASPSYCAEKEKVSLFLANRLSDNKITIKNREMADLILKNKQLSVVSKTINQYSVMASQQDQFYYSISRNCMIGIQLPIAIVAMKPTVYLKFNDIEALWDYGLIEDFCPNVSPVILTDSDIFLMMELREKTRGLKDLVYEPKAENNDGNLQNTVTQYSGRFINEILILHSKDINLNDIKNESRILKDYANNTLNNNKPLRSHKNHIQWLVHYDNFQIKRNHFIITISDFKEFSSTDQINQDNISIFLNSFSEFLKNKSPLKINFEDISTARNLLLSCTEKNKDLVSDNRENFNKFLFRYSESSQNIKDNFSVFFDSIFELTIDDIKKNSIRSDNNFLTSPIDKKIIFEKNFLDSINFNYSFFHPTSIITVNYVNLLKLNINTHSNILYISGALKFQCLRGLSSQITSLDVSDVSYFSFKNIGLIKFNLCIIEGSYRDFANFKKIANEISPLLEDQSRIIALFIYNKTLDKLFPKYNDCLYESVNFNYCGRVKERYYSGLMLNMTLKMRDYMIAFSNAFNYKVTRLFLVFIYFPISTFLYLLYKLKIFNNPNKNFMKSKITLLEIDI